MDDSAVPTYALFLPTAIIGIALNSWIMVSICLNPAMVRARLDRILVLLVATCLYFSVEITVRDLVQLWVQSPVFDNLSTAATYISFVLLLGTQLMLAMCRYTESKDLPEKDTKPRFIVVGAIMFFFVCASVIIYATGVEGPGVGDAIFTLFCLFAVYCVFGAIFYYTWASILLNRRIQQNLPSRMEETVRLHLQKKVLKSCMLMTGGCIFCYFPEVFNLVIRNILAQRIEWYNVVCTEFVMLDTLASPSLALILLPSFRLEVLKPWTRKPPVLDSDSRSRNFSELSESVELSVST
ncbi:hypothetical protein HDU83_002851 [Entophlyctis luteolus]|nr:hypothetical protein HDU82_007016 [Entophlyctis luteolus]KAJ3346605.1 hypothetical protein HDU83_002851 [Entophlyctis luteolus]KAJ3385126.1 hypothetical protein HDU84_002446 [Entophlyctis sp. JEL0112]